MRQLTPEGPKTSKDEHMPAPLRAFPILPALACWHTDTVEELTHLTHAHSSSPWMALAGIPASQASSLKILFNKL